MTQNMNKFRVNILQILRYYFEVFYSNVINRANIPNIPTQYADQIECLDNGIRVVIHG